MTKDLQVFDFNEYAVRVIMQDGEPWWVAKDVCNILDIQNVTQAVDRLDDDERSMFNIGRQGEVNIINESGLYNLIFRSDKHEAKKFRKWVTSEVLPEIRRTGGYNAGEKLRELDIKEAEILQRMLVTPNSELNRSEKRKISLAVLAKLEKSSLSYQTGKKFYTGEEIADELEIEVSTLLQEASINSLLMHGYKDDDSNTWYFTSKGRSELIRLFTKGPRKKKQPYNPIDDKWKVGWKELGWA